MPRGNQQYEFEMFDLRKQLLALVAEKARAGELDDAKWDGKRLIRRLGKKPGKNASSFETSFERAMAMVLDGRSTADDVTYQMEVEDMPPILEDHDGEITTEEINGTATSLVRSVKEQRFGQTEENVYPVYKHEESGYRVCSCPAQKYHLICPHTLARVIERNVLPEEQLVHGD